jgi:hypothetical protein
MKIKPQPIVAVAILFLLAIPIVYPIIKGNAVKLDTFEGTITNIDLRSGVYEGVGVYDRSCNMVGNGLTQCDAGIETKEGLVNFNYKHNMDLQPCLDAGQNLVLEVFEGGKAIVKRI